MSIERLVEGHRIVVCVGTGGVGKTTTAAALALAGARGGRRAMVLTIDPARRLAQSLGVESLRSGGETISGDVLGAAGLSLEGNGSLTAGMLDQKSAWDEFIARHAPTPEIRDTILANEFYQHLSRSFAGSTEYMAIEELCRIDESGQYDLIVLDTPPTGHALDFLEAPRRLEDFLDRSMIGWFVKPYFSVGWSAWKKASRTMRFLFERIEKATGTDTLRQISEFFMAMEQLFDGIAERSRKVRALLSGETTAFVLVAGPDEQILGESELLTAKMETLGVSLRGVIMNRVHPMPSAGEYFLDEEEVEAWAAALVGAGIDAPVARWLLETYETACTVARADEVRRETFEASLPEDVVFAAIPELEHDVHDLSSLADVGALLFD